MLNTYVGKRRVRSGALVAPRYPLAIWNVSGMASRTNNAAESVHAQMNPKVNGKVTPFRFLSTVEEQMETTNRRIRTACKSETRAVEAVKNQLLAAELYKLLNNDQGILIFLDNCGSIVSLKSVREANRFVPHTIAPFEDIDWRPANRERVFEAARGLYLRTCPETETDMGDVLESVASWAFQVPPDPDVHIGPSETQLSLIDQRPMMIYESIRENLERETSRPVQTVSEGESDEDDPFETAQPFILTEEDFREMAQRDNSDEGTN